MRTSIAAALLCLVAFHARTARADAKTKKDIQQKVKEAMENYDLLDYEAAKKLLNQALTEAKKAKMDSDPVVAQVDLSLGIVYYSGLQDTDSAKLSFVSACQIDPKVKIDPGYKTADMQKALDEACSGGGGGGGGDDGGGGDGGGDLNIDVGGGGDSGGGDTGDVDCSSVSGVQHEIVDTGTAGKALSLSASIGSDVSASKVAIMYRAEGKTDFSELKMSKKGGCTYVGAIPKDAMNGETVQYYIGAYNDKGKMIAGKGSSGSPNIVEIEGGTAVASAGDNGDDENPLGEGGEGGARKGSDVEAHVTGGPTKPAKVYLTVAAGSGVGFVTGSTEQEANKVQCCFAPALFNVMPEIGFYVAPTTSVGVQFRLGMPIGANIPGHSTGSPAAFIRIRHSLGKGQTGISVNGAIGGGVIGDTISLTQKPMDCGPNDGPCDTDIVGMGPVFIGGGATYIAALGGPIKFVADVGALAGIPVIKKLGSNPGTILNFGVQIDLNLGFMFGF